MVSPTLQCTLRLYALDASGHKEEGDFGELHLGVWLTSVTDDLDSPVMAPGTGHGAW